MQSVDRWYAKTLTDHPTMRAHCYSLLKTILETARMRDRIIESNPCAIRGAGTTERKIKPKPATLEQLGIIVGEMPDNLRLMVLLATWAALRFDELVEGLGTSRTLAWDADDPQAVVAAYAALTAAIRAKMKMG